MDVLDHINIASLLENTGCLCSILERTLGSRCTLAASSSYLQLSFLSVFSSKRGFCYTEGDFFLLWIRGGFFATEIISLKRRIWDVKFFIVILLLEVAFSISCFVRSRILLISLWKKINTTFTYQ